MLNPRKERRNAHASYARLLGLEDDDDDDDDDGDHHSSQHRLYHRDVDVGSDGGRDGGAGAGTGAGYGYGNDGDGGGVDPFLDDHLVQAREYVRETRAASFEASSAWKRFLVSVAKYDARVHRVPGHLRLKDALKARKIACEMAAFAAAIDDERVKLRRQKEALHQHRASLLARLEARTRDKKRLRAALRTETNPKTKEETRRMTTTIQKKKTRDEEEEEEEDDDQEDEEEEEKVEDSVADADADDPIAACRRLELRFLSDRIKLLLDLLASVSSLMAANEEASIWNAIESDWSVVSFFQRKERISEMLHDAVVRRQDNDQKSAEIGCKVELLGKKDLVAELRGVARS